MKVRDVIHLLTNDGWHEVRVRGSHRHFRHLTKPGTVTVPGAMNENLHPKTLGSVLKQAGLRKGGAK